MNCYSFKKKLDLYLEGELQKDIKASMDKHISQCEQCRKIYEEEKEIEELLFKALSFEKIDFKSSRNEIISSIDKDKYKKGYKSNVKFHFIKNKKMYVMAASFLLILIMIPFMKNYIAGLRSENQIAKSVSADKDKSKTLTTENNNNTSNKISGTGEASNSYQDTVKKSDVATMTIDKMDDVLSDISRKYHPVDFYKLSEDKQKEMLLKGQSKAKASPSNKYQAYIIGKGENVDKEGAGALAIRDTSSGKLKYYEVGEDLGTVSPLYVEWYDDDNLLVIVGMAYGKVTKGGSVYLLNMKSNNTVLVYGAQVPLEQVVSLSNNKGSLNLSIIKYKDNNMTSYDTTNKTINYSIEDKNTLLDSKQKHDEMFLLEEYNKLFNGDTSIKESNILSGGVKLDYIKNDANNFGLLLKANINRVLSINSYEYNKFIEKFGLSDFKVYVVELKDDKNNSYIYQMIILGKEKKQSNWKIYHVYTIPQGYADIKN
ncbi:DUF4652 domain-containing protein [Clostridium sp. C8-1-8]|uniref:DUF4652 domain-containing protein n=1 Tax=Clostridium sp. C8-1-8 TaxID=2698831 RepID=UPI0013691088|nr:DUF4652 domain-containing protein [Clostridium sp. C8-1-8]